MTKKSESRKPVVILNGFLVNVEIPSEARLTVQVNLTSMRQDITHLTWVSDMQDLLAHVDSVYQARYSKRAGRGRSVKVKYLKVARDKQIKIAECQPYPSVWINKLKEVRKKVYEELNTYCLILQEEIVGRMKRKVYFLPTSLAPKLMNRIEEANETLRNIQNHLSDYEKTQYFAQVVRHIKKAEPEIRAFHVDLPPIRVVPVPLSLSRSFFETYLEEEARKALVAVDKEKQRGLELLKKEIERERTRMIKSINESLTKKLANFVSEAEKAVEQFMRYGRSKKKARFLTKRFTKLTELVENVGADPAPFKALTQVFEALTKDDKKAVSEAVTALASSVGAPVSEEPLQTVKAVSKVVQGKSLLLLTID